MATITKIENKRGVSYRVQIRKFEKGKIIYSEAKTFPKRSLAEKWAAAREGELQEPGGADRLRASGITVADLIDRYITDFCGSAGRTKSADLKTLKGYDFASLPIDRLTAEVLIDHARERLLTVKPQTLLNDFVWLRNVYQAAYPAWGIKVSTMEIDAAKAFCSAKGMIQKSTSRDRRPTKEELEALDAHFASRDGRAEIPMQEIMWFAIHSCRRQSEITRLRWVDNDENNRTGLVRDLKHPRKKSGNHARFKYTNEAWEIIEKRPKVGEFIFPFNSKSVGAAFTRACHILGIEDLHFHDLRREGVSRLFEKGYSITEVVLFSLHHDWQVLRRYTKLSPESVVIRD